MLVTLAAAALIVGGSLTLLRTSWGGDVARRIGLRVANQQLAGRLEARRLRFDGDHVRLDDVVLRDPRGGAVVARVRRLDVSFRPFALLRRHVDLSRVVLVGPELNLVLDPDGTNLARALTARAPAPPSSGAPGAPPAPSRLVLAVGDLDLVDGTFDLRTPGAPAGAPLRHLRAENVDARVAGKLAVAGWRFEGRVSVTARALAPKAAPLSLEVNAKGEGDRRTGAVKLTLGGGVLDATAETHRAANGAFAASARLRRLHVPHGLVRAVLPEVPLAAPVDATGVVALVGEALRAEAHVVAGGGTIDAKGVLDVAQARVRELAIDGHDLDLGRVVAGLPRSSLPFQLRAHGSLAPARGELSFSTPGGLLGGYSLGPVRLRAGVVRGGFELTELRAALPGADVTASGWARAGEVELRARLTASDLAKTGRALGPAVAPLGLGGRGRFELGAKGSLERPTFSARGRFDALKVRGISTGSLALSASLLGQRLTIDARMTAPQPLSLHVESRVALARGAVSLDALELASPEARWRLAAPARIVVGPGALEVAGFDLRSGAQALRVDVAAGRSGRIDARLDVAALDLARLPKLVQPRGRELGGRLDLTARVTGTRRRPSLAARLSLANARVGAVRDLALSLELQATRARAVGTFSARGLTTSARGRFDVPATWPMRGARGPLEVDLDLAPTDLAEVSRLLRLPGPSLGGRLALSLRVTGTPADPAARLEVTTKDLVVAGTPLGAPRLSVEGARDAPSRLRVDVRSDRLAPLAGSLTLETPATLGWFLRGKPSLEALLRTSFSARGDVHGIPLALAAQVVNVGGEVRGTAALRFDVTGTARAPRGAVNVSVSGATGEAFPPTDGRLDVALGERDTRVAARLARQGQPRPLAAVSAVWGTSLARLWDRGVEAAAEAPLDAWIYAGPVDVKHATYLPREVGPPQDLHARARLTAHLTGTLSRPVAEATAAVSRARVGAQDVGHAVVQLRYADAQARLTADATSDGGGTLRLQAGAHVDLGWPRGIAALDPPNLPVDATLAARAFDLAWLSGLVDAVRLVDGKLEGSARVGGTLAAPVFAGRLEWKDGAVAITEIGEYRDVHLALSASQGRFSIEDLRASSRGGTAHLTGQATRTPQGHLDVSAKADLSRFPIHGQGDVLGTLSTRLALRADVSKRGAKGRLKIEEAKGELGEIRRKDVQSLERPDDVVLVSRGRPVNQAEARRLMELAAARAGGGATTSAPAEAAWTAEAEIVAPRNVWVRGEEAQLELGLSPGFKVETGAATRVFGSVLVRRGTVDVLGRRFTLQKDSRVTFDGAPDQPSLDVVARHVNERSKVTVVVSLRGTPADLRVDVSSPDRPDLNQTQLYGLLVTGQLDVGERAATGSSGLSSEAASLVGGLLASSLQKTLRKRLPLDVLTIQAGTGLAGSRLEAGTYIGSRLYVGYVGRVGSDPILLQNRNAVRVEYQFTSRWSLDAEYGDVGTGTADVVWNKHY